MPNAKEVKKRFLTVGNLEQLRDFFVFLDPGFRPHVTEDGLDIDISDSDYMEVYVYKDRSEIQKRARRASGLRFCQLAISPDFTDWTFVRHGVEGRVRLLKYRIQKSAIRDLETPVAMQRLAKLKAGQTAGFEDLFDRKDISSRFYTEYAKKRVQLIKQISGIEDDSDRRWFAQVLLDRIIFLYFLQKKQILAGDDRYLVHRLQKYIADSSKKSPSFYRGFLVRMFFETLCIRTEDRSAELDELTGKGLPYLNGGLFLKHDLEEKYPDIDVDNRALSEVFQFLESWMWNVSERSETDEDAIDPYILGYIFEKSLGENKSQGVYYTPPFLSEFLARETIQTHLLRYVGKVGASGRYAALSEFLAKAPEDELVYLFEHLRTLSVCDPACGSGQFLVQSLHELSSIHESIIERAQKGKMDQLLRHIGKDYSVEGEHVYAVRRFIVAHNLYGVDMLAESVEITKLRLFIGMVEGLEREIREPLPNIDFNIRTGNSLIGFTEKPRLVRESSDAAQEQFSLDFGAVEETFHSRELKILSYYNFADPKKARALKNEIQKITDQLRGKLNAKLNQFIASEWKVRPKKKIDFVDLTKDASAKKAYDAFELRAEDVNAFHWIMEFSNILMPGNGQPGGFDIVLLNPPWEVWKPNSQEFFEKEIDGFREMDKNQARKAVEEAFARKKLKKSWIEYSLGMSAVSEYFRACGQYPERGQGDINLYKLFLERAFSLLRGNGSLGIVMPSGFYSDLGCKDLRKMFLDASQIHFLYGFENSKAIFEDVHRSFKFVLFSASRAETPGASVPSAFMMHTEGDLNAAHVHKPDSRFVDLPRKLIEQLSPETLSLMEFRSELDIRIVQKMARFPRLGEELPNTWNVKLSREFDMTNDAHLFVTREQLEKKGAEYNAESMIWKKGKEEWWPLYEGRMVTHYDHRAASYVRGSQRSAEWFYQDFPKAKPVRPQYWIEQSVERMSESGYKIYICDVTGSSNKRTGLATVVRRSENAANSLGVIDAGKDPSTLLLLACCNAFAVDYFARQRMPGNHYNQAVIQDIPVPRFQSPADHVYYLPLVDRAARLCGTTAAYDDLLREVFGKTATHKTHGVTDPAERQKMKNEIDAMVARIYELTEEELLHVLSTFPLVEQEIKDGVMEEWRKLG